MQPSFGLLLLVSLIVFSCGTKHEEQEQRSGSSASSTVLTERSDRVRNHKEIQSSPSNADTLLIDRKAAVFYQPDSIQIEKRMKQVGEADFRAGMDDYIYSLNTSVEYLKKESLPVFDAKNKKYLKFVLADKKVQLIKLDTLEELWGMYLFDPNKTPFAADMTIIEEEYKSYFN